MSHRTKEARWRDLESTADMLNVQELIRYEILSGTIRVRPKPGGGIRIVPVGMPEREVPIEEEPQLAPSQEETSLSGRVARRGRLARN